MTAPAGGGTTAAVAPPAPVKTTAKAAAPMIPGRAIVGVQSRLCLSAAAGKDGVALVIATCNGSAVQHWEALSDGTIRSVGLCMDAAWAGTDVFTVVQVAYCSGNRAQQWRLNTSNDLVSVNADKCADVIDQRTTNGSAVKLYWCNGQDNQKWFWR
ncbi:ricin-type beta-trefoil lectin domain protein [Dactylosporangium sp. NBC_01737]|uniref:ricin-type beta-trefoil lectin domain protein n=1 Tax=Dactylosporangium sp. NBC_01737 TaxID=2975959 RepID=UPI002E15A0AA|nr:ricin-type beta-trefoil lectin domain protein [Dactylosporangium sp. NBC_01737]